nr:MAG TPA: antitoxin [Caudoviricetes sp.]
MDHDDIQLEFSDPDPITNTQKVTLTVPADVAPEVAKQMLINAIQSSVSDSVKTMYRDYIREREVNLEDNEWYKALINIGGESK